MNIKIMKYKIFQLKQIKIH